MANERDLRSAPRLYVGYNVESRDLIYTGQPARKEPWTLEQWSRSLRTARLDRKKLSARKPDREWRIVKELTILEVIE